MLTTRTRLTRAAVLIAVFHWLSGQAVAQSVVNPTRLEFGASADHDAESDGVPLVSGYQLELYLDGAQAPFQTVSLGKPALAQNGTITVALGSILVPLPTPGINYTAAVAALGPGGIGRSSPTNSFMWSAPPTCSYAVSPLSQSMGQAAGTFNASVTAGSGCGWTASENLSWVSIASGASGSGNGTVTFSVTGNTGTSARSGAVTVAGQTINLTQSGSGCTYSIAPTSQSISAAGGTATVSVTAGSGCSWTASENSSWISITSGAAGSGNGTVTYSVSVNSGSASRTVALTVAGQTVNVSQSGSNCTYSVSPATQSLPSTAGSSTVTVTTPSNCSWTATDNRTWITITAGQSGTGNGTITYLVTANTGTASRSGTLTVATASVALTQTSPSATPVAPSNLRFVTP